jgi:Fe-S-cluster containining protein
VANECCDTMKISPSSNIISNMDIENQIKRFHKNIYAGPNGAKRKKFVIAYGKAYSQIWENTERLFAKQLSMQGQTISCKKGCTYCCFQYTLTNLAQGFIILDYLFQNDKALRLFLRNYSRMDKQALSVAEEIDLKVLSGMSVHASSDRNNLAIESLNSKYLDFQVPCPFLEDAVCSIYPVRPGCCAAHRSTSPPEWCSKNDSHQGRTREIWPPEKDTYRLADLGNRTFALYQIGTPRLVYDLIIEGPDEVYLRAQKLIPPIFG